MLLCGFDKVNDGQCFISDFAEALSNPLAWLSEQDRHQKQLEVFDEDDEVVSKTYLMVARLLSSSQVAVHQSDLVR